MRFTVQTRVRILVAAGAWLGMLGVVNGLHGQALGGGSHSVRPQLTGRVIDQGALVPLPGNVLRGVARAKDLGAVEDSSVQSLFLSLKRTPAQEADLESLIAEQQQAGSASFHKWLTPEAFGERFGVAEGDIKQITLWLESQGFAVTGVPRNNSLIQFKATAGGVRNTFHSELHTYEGQVGRFTGVASAPQIPAALSGLVAGIAGLNRVPAREHRAPAIAAGSAAVGVKPQYNLGGGFYAVVPQDFYTIYNLNPTFSSGNTGKGATIAIVNQDVFNYGTVTNGKASGGDVSVFRKLFGVTGTLDLEVQHGSAHVTCDAATGLEPEMAADTEWLSSVAPNAKLIIAACSEGTGGLLSAFQFVVDDNQADVVVTALGIPEDPGLDTTAYETAFAQAATQGQTILAAQGDGGADDKDLGFPGPATSGLGIVYPGSSPRVLSVGATDFQDLYDVDMGSTTPQSTYWGATNNAGRADALSYVPETAFSGSCANSLIAKDPKFGNGKSPAVYCSGGLRTNFGGGGGGGVSTLFAQPSYQKGIPGLSASTTHRATPDISAFGGVVWKHQLVYCDSNQPDFRCASTDTIGGYDGTGVVASQYAGIFGLLVAGTGSRQGMVQPNLYALAKAEYAASGSSCYANGQSSNTGVTTKLPAASCVFHDVTTGNNDSACVPGSPNCYTVPGASTNPDEAGVLTASGDNTVLAIAYPAGVGYDLATGLGSVNVTNLINGWKGSAPPPGCLPSAAGVKICAPAAGATGVASPITISAGAIAKTGNITAIRVYLDNVSQTTVNNPAKTTSFSISQAVTASAGSHSLVIVAYESTGGSIQANETIVIAGSASQCPPSTTGARICAPGSGATVASPVQVTAGATVLSGGYISAIRLYVDNGSKATVTNTAKTRSFVFDQPVTLAKGKHTLTIVGYESVGGKAVTAADTIVVE